MRFNTQQDGCRDLLKVVLTVTGIKRCTLALSMISSLISPCSRFALELIIMYLHIMWTIYKEKCTVLSQTIFMETPEMLSLCLGFLISCNLIGHTWKDQWQVQIIKTWTRGRFRTCRLPNVQGSITARVSLITLHSKTGTYDWTKVTWQQLKLSLKKPKANGSHFQWPFLIYNYSKWCAH